MEIFETLDVLNITEKNEEISNVETIIEEKQDPEPIPDVADEKLEPVFNVVDIDENIVEFWTNIDGEIEGDLSIKNKDQELIAKLSFSSGLLNGKATFYSDGIIIREEEYKNGLKNGELKSFHGNGETSSVENYKEGKLSGVSTKFYDNGQIFEDASYINGKMNGQFVRYFSDGNLMEECSYANGEKNGICITYNPDGSIKLTEDFS